MGTAKAFIGRELYLEVSGKGKSDLLILKAQLRLEIKYL